MRVPVVQTSVATQDIWDVANYVGRDDPRIGLRFQRRFDETMDFLAETPEGGALLETDIEELFDVRTFQIKGFKKYVIIYEYSRGEIRLLRVIHGARDFETLLSV